MIFVHFFTLLVEGSDLFASSFLRLAIVAAFDYVSVSLYAEIFTLYSRRVVG